MSALERLERARERRDLSSMAEVLRRRWLIMAAVVLASIAGAVVLHEHKAKSYNATASVAFRSSTLSDAALQVTLAGSGEPIRDAATEVLIAHSSEVAEGVRKQLHLKSSPSELLGAVKVEAAPSADVLNVIASSQDPQEASALANAFAEQYIAFKTNSQISSIEAAQLQLRRQIASLPATSPERATLRQSIQRLGELRAIAGGSANVIGRATPPSTPAGLSLSTTVAMGLLIGLAISLFLVYLLESLDRRVKDIDEFEYAYQLPVLTSIPESSFRARRAAERTASLEPYRILRSALDIVAVTKQLDTLLVTSAVPGEGKTTVAVDLAHTVALAGRPVALIELDLRRPTFPSQLAVDPSKGVTTALAYTGSVGELLAHPFADLPNFAVLPAGRLPPNPAELLGSAKLGELVSLLAQEYMVIIDAPPLNPVSDTHVLLASSAIHAAIVVARADHTTKEDVRRARTVISRHPLQVIGLVITGLRDDGRYGYETRQPTPSAPEAPVVSDDYSLLSRPSSDRMNLRLVS